MSLSKGRINFRHKDSGGACLSWHGHNSVVDEFVKSRPELRLGRGFIGQSVENDVDFLPSEGELKARTTA